jgi:uncharacterized membrane protein
MANVGDIITKVTMFGVAGWLAENALCQQGDQYRYSALFRNAKIPFMPIYAVNGVALTAVAPYVSKWPTLARGLAYSVLGTVVEFVGCQIDRKVLGGTPAWDYGRGEALANVSGGCVSFTRSALWGGMGLIAEKVT